MVLVAEFMTVSTLSVHGTVLGRLTLLKRGASAVAVAGGVVAKTLTQGADDDGELMITEPVAIACDVDS